MAGRNFSWISQTLFEIVSRYVRDKRWARYNRAGFAGLIVSEGRGELEVVHTESMWSRHGCEKYRVSGENENDGQK